MPQGLDGGPEPTVAMKSIPLRGYTIPQVEVANILSRLQAVVQEFGRLEVGAESPPTDDDSFAQWEEQKARYQEFAFRITTTISGDDGESVFAPTVDTVFNANTPRRVFRTYSTNRTAYQAANGRHPLNEFQLTLDFTSPPVLDTNPVSDPTINDSALHIRGSENWVSSIEAAVIGILRSYRNRRSVFHGAFVYDLGVLLVGIPGGLAASYLAQPLIANFMSNTHIVVQAGAYIYLFYCSLIFYRLVFGYLRWIFPTVEMQSERVPAYRHRKFWFWTGGVVVAAWLGWLVLPG